MRALCANIPNVSACAVSTKCAGVGRTPAAAASFCEGCSTVDMTGGASAARASTSASSAQAPHFGPESNLNRRESVFNSGSIRVVRNADISRFLSNSQCGGNACARAIWQRYGGVATDWDHALVEDGVAVATTRRPLLAASDAGNRSHFVLRHAPGEHGAVRVVVRVHNHGAVIPVVQINPRSIYNDGGGTHTLTKRPQKCVPHPVNSVHASC